MESIPCYFDIYLELEPLSLVFEIPSSLVARIKSLYLDAMINFRGGFGESHFGQGTTIKIESQTEQFYRLRAIIPEGFLYTDKVCSSCQGKKIDRKYLSDYNYTTFCRDCCGSGLEATKQSQLVHELADNLVALFKLIDRVTCRDGDDLVHNHKKMLMFLLLTNGGYMASGIGGYFTKDLENYLLFVLSQKEQDFLTGQVSEAMARVHDLISYGHNPERAHRDFFDFRVHISSSQDRAKLYLEVPGQNSCSVYTAGGMVPVCYPVYKFDVRGLTCHNIDYPLQQVSLISGLAYICTLAKQYYYVLDSIKYRHFFLSKLTKAMS